MAIGYGKIIAKAFNSYYTGLMDDLTTNFQSYTPGSHDICGINDEGEQFVTDVNAIHECLRTHLHATFKFRNEFQNAITISVQIIDNYIIEECYYMDELIEDSEQNMLLNFMKQRFWGLLEKNLSIGFVFDKEGYSEDYILIPPPNWRSSDDCWRRLMGG
jgi:hypothetical protein